MCLSHACERWHMKDLYGNNNSRNSPESGATQYKGLVKTIITSSIQEVEPSQGHTKFLCKKWLVHSKIHNNYDHPSRFMIIIMFQLIPPKADTQADT